MIEMINGERTPLDLCAADFATYPPSARLFARAHLPTLRTLPIVLCVLILKQVVKYDLLFPAEREDLSQLLQMIASERSAQIISAFRKIDLSAETRKQDWITRPGTFVEVMTNELWSSGQIDRFRDAAERLIPQNQIQPGGVPRIVIVDLDSRLDKKDFVLFRRLLQHGTLFTNLSLEADDDPFTASLQLLEYRARTSVNPYCHWVISGDIPPRTPTLEVSTVDYKTLEPVRFALLALMNAAVNSGTSGPEALRSAMMSLEPDSLGMTPSIPFFKDPLLTQFCLDLLGQGSGAQVYSTSFVQWAAREVLRRARPSTAIIRFTPRVQQQSTNQQWSRTNITPAFDFAGSLIDADMATYYTWINLRRLSDTNCNYFVAFHSGRRQAFVSGPGMADGSYSDQAISPSKLFSFLSLI